MIYRPYIDGLRAIAVLPVVAYHALINFFNGGFVGVDVFFVISGYLISSIIFSDLEQRKFSFALFYQRRAARILPAFLAVIFATSILSYRYLLPVEFSDFASSAIAALLSASNIYFWAVSGYFDIESWRKPALQTWSLGVEEQYYVIFPIVVFLCWRISRLTVRPVIVGLCLASFVASALLTVTDRDSAFYLMPLRFWELGLGTLLALGIFPAIRREALRNLVAIAGLAAIAFAVFRYDSHTSFPGAAALLPCLGTAAIIWSCESGQTFVGRLLSLSPLRFVGKVSYSLYLWHWPIIVFQKDHALIFADSNSIYSKVGIVIISMGVAVVSWRVIEIPFRSWINKISVREALVGSGAAIGAVASVLLVVVLSGGLTGRFPPDAIAYAAYLRNDNSHFRASKCMTAPREGLSSFAKEECLSDVAGKPSYLLIGESYAGHWWFGLNEAIPEINVQQATAAGCKPTVAAYGAANLQCRELIDFIYKEFLTTHKPEKIIIVARWNARDLEPLAETLRHLRDRQHNVVVLGLLPQYSIALPRLLAESIRFNDPQFPQTKLDPAIERIDGQLKKIADDNGAQFISLYKALCPEGQCLTLTDNGVPLQFDYGHLTAEGSEAAARRIRQQVLANGTARPDCCLSHPSSN